MRLVYATLIFFCFMRLPPAVCLNRFRGTFLPAEPVGIVALYLTDTSGKRRAVAVPMVRASFVVGMVDEAAFKMRVFLEKNVPTVAGVSGLERHGKAA